MVGCVLWGCYWKYWAYEATLNFQWILKSLQQTYCLTYLLLWRIVGPYDRLYPGLCLLFSLNRRACYFHWITVKIKRIKTPHAKRFFYLNTCQVVFFVQFQGIPILEGIYGQFSYKIIVREVNNSQVRKLIINFRTL